MLIRGTEISITKKRHKKGTDQESVDFELNYKNKIIS
jgi:plasmid replication initiation protein